MISLCGFGVSNYYNKLKLALLEKGVPYRERTVYPWQRDDFWQCSPIGKIPFVETDEGDLSESQVILDYLEDRYPDRPLYPADAFARAKCRELIQHLELNCEWVARRLYAQSFFGGTVSDETRREARVRLVLGLQGVARLSPFTEFALGDTLTAADCAAYVHLTMIDLTARAVFSEDLVDQHLPGFAAYMARMRTRPHVQRMESERAQAMEAFLALGVDYKG